MAPVMRLCVGAYWRCVTLLHPPGFLSVNAYVLLKICLRSAFIGLSKSTIPSFYLMLIAFKLITFWLCMSSFCLSTVVNRRFKFQVTWSRYHLNDSRENWNCASFSFSLSLHLFLYLFPSRMLSLRLLQQTANDKIQHIIEYASESFHNF